MYTTCAQTTSARATTRTSPSRNIRTSSFTSVATLVSAGGTSSVADLMSNVQNAVGPDARTAAREALLNSMHGSSTTMPWSQMQRFVKLTVSFQCVPAMFPIMITNVANGLHDPRRAALLMYSVLGKAASASQGQTQAHAGGLIGLCVGAGITSVLGADGYLHAAYGPLASVNVVTPLPNKKMTTQAQTQRASELQRRARASNTRSNARSLAHFIRSIETIDNMAQGSIVFEHEGDQVGVTVPAPHNIVSCARQGGMMRMSADCNDDPNLRSGATISVMMPERSSGDGEAATVGGMLGMMNGLANAPGLHASVAIHRVGDSGFAELGINISGKLCGRVLRIDVNKIPLPTTWIGDFDDHKRSMQNSAQRRGRGAAGTARSSDVSSSSSAAAGAAAVIEASTAVRAREREMGALLRPGCEGSCEGGSLQHLDAHMGTSTSSSESANPGSSMMSPLMQAYLKENRHFLRQAAAGVSDADFDSAARNCDSPAAFQHAIFSFS